MSISVEDGPRSVPLLPQVCGACGARLHATIVGPRCPVHGVEWAG